MTELVTEARNQIPYNFKPRPYQAGVWTAWNLGIRRFCTVWHRRSGKDKNFLNFMIRQMVDRVGTYNYVFPYLNQGRRILWDGIGKDGFRYMDHFPSWILYGPPNQQEMKLTIRKPVFEADGSIRFPEEPGSVFQIVGTDNPDSLVGTNPVGVVMSEYSLQDPQGWKLLSPILLENHGWAAFAYTPRGRNHGWKLYENARKNPKWYCELLTIDDTRDHDGSVIVSQADIDEEIRMGLMDPELAEQEYFCSFEGSMQGSYYGRLLQLMRAEKRVGRVPYDPQLPVVTTWDLGMDDATAIWLIQTVGREVRLIEYYENRGFGLSHYAKFLREKPYTYDTHYLPHDVKVRELGTGTSREKILRDLGLQRIKVIPRANPEDRVEAVRRLLPMCWADEEKCDRGLDALGSYRREYDEKKQEFRNTPLHDWSSHAADSLGHFALMFRGFRDGGRQTRADSYFNPHDYERAGQTMYDTSENPYDA